MKRNYGFRDIPPDHPMPPEMQAQYDRKMAEIRAAERRKHPDLVLLGFIRRFMSDEAS